VEKVVRVDSHFETGKERMIQTKNWVAYPAAVWKKWDSTGKVVDVLDM
jgi:hypothetical protein